MGKAKSFKERVGELETRLTQLEQQVCRHYFAFVGTGDSGSLLWQGEWVCRKCGERRFKNIFCLTRKERKALRVLGIVAPR